MMTREILTCQECGNDYMSTPACVNGPVIFRCEFCNMYRRDKLAVQHYRIQRWTKYWTVAGYIVGILFVAYIFLWPLID